MATNAELGRMPGVRVKEILNADLGIISPQFRIAGLVSTSFTSLLKRDIIVIRGTGDTDTLTDFTADEVTSVECISPYQEAYGTQRIKLTPTTDYTVEDNVITFTTAGKAKVAAGDTYYVTAKISKLSDHFFAPIEMQNFSQVVKEYGPEYDATNQTVNSMVAMAHLMFNAGAKRIVCVQAKTASAQDYTDAIAKLEEVGVQYVLCSGNNVTGVNEALLTHVVKMSTVENSMPRVGFTSTVQLEPTVDQVITTANALKSQNMVLTAPGKVLIVVEDENGTSYEKWVSGNYANAAIIGMLCNPSRRLATPLTRKDITQYGILDAFVHYKKQDTEKMAANGVNVLLQRKSSNTIVVNQGLTTDNTNYGSYYLNIVCCKYEVARLLQAYLDETFVGTEILEDTVSLVQSSIRNTLDGFKGLYLNNYKDLSVTRDADIPTKLNVRFKMSGIFGLDYIDMEFSVYVQ
jgi:SpoU rRNA methylase family enzyme